MPKQYHRLTRAAAVPPSGIRDNFAQTGYAALFPLLLIYYWLMQFADPLQVVGLREEYLYVMFVGPMTAYAAVGVLVILAGGRQIRTDVWVLVLLLAIVTVASVARTDLSTILTMGLMCITLALIVHLKITVNPTLVNILFILSIPLAFLYYNLGLSLFPVVPSLDSIATLSWRVSVLPPIASGGFFALIVLFTNLFHPSAKLRAFCLPAAAFFLLFSGLRTAIFSGLLAGLYVLVRRRGLLRSHGSKIAFFGAAVAFFTLSIFSSEQLARLPILSNDFLRSLIVRDENPYGNLGLGDQVFTAAIRSWMIGEHLELGMSNPLFGVGTFNLALLQSGYDVFDNLASGSEAYLTGLFARIGLPMVLLLYVIFRFRPEIPVEQRDFVRCMKLFLFLAMITYGSFITPYDFIFLLMIVAIFSGYRGWRPEALPRRLPLPDAAPRHA